MRTFGLLQFPSRRRKAAVVMAAVLLVGFVGPWLAIFAPPLFGVLMIFGIILWYVPAVLFSSTHWFRFHEFGGGPISWQGYLLTFVFYAVLVLIFSWPFAWRRRDGAAGED